MISRREAGRLLINRPVTLPDKWEGRIESVSPLRVRVRGSVPDATPDTLVGDLAVGNPVWGETVNGRSVILGRFGGAAVEGIPGGANLNSYVTPGVATQASTSQAATGTNYPEPSAGLLETFTLPNDPSMIWQRFTTYPAAGGMRLWLRGFYTSWRPWSLIAGQVPWTAVSVASGYSATSLAVKRVGDQVFWRGRIESANFASTGSKVVVADGVLPSQFRPSSFAFSRRRIDLSGTPTGSATFDVGADGECTVRVLVAPTGAPEAFINLDYWVD